MSPRTSTGPRVITIRRPFGLIGVVVAAVVYALLMGAAVSGCAVPSSSTSRSSSTPAAAASSAARSSAPGKTTPTAAAPAAAPGVSRDNGWVLVAVPKVTRAGSIMTVHARVRNDSDGHSALITLTYDPNGTPVVFTGAANDVERGKTVTVDLLSTDHVTKVPTGTPELRVTAGF